MQMKVVMKKKKTKRQTMNQLFKALLSFQRMSKINRGSQVKKLKVTVALHTVNGALLTLNRLDHKYLKNAKPHETVDTLRCISSTLLQQVDTERILDIATH